MNYCELLDQANAEGLMVKEKPFRTFDGRIKGETIYLRKDMDTIQKKCVLAEELGHYYTAVGDILDMNDIQNVKVERHGRLWSYNNQIGLFNLIRAYRHGCKNRHEIAEFLEVTEEFLQEAIDCYRDKYGICTTIDNYVIYFIPNLAIGEHIDI